MPRQSFQTFRIVYEIADILLLLISLAKLRIHCQRFVNGDIKFLGDHFCNGIHLGIGHIKNTPHIPDHTAGSQGTEGYDLNHTVVSVFPPDVVNNLLTPFKAEIHINIRHGNSLRIQETLKQQIVFNRIKLGDSQCIGVPVLP